VIAAWLPTISEEKKSGLPREEFCCCDQQCCEIKIVLAKASNKAKISLLSFINAFGFDFRVSPVKIRG